MGHDEPREEPEPDDAPLTHGMMIAALNQILSECGYPPVEPDDTAYVPHDVTADRLIADARTRADGIVAAALETAEQYTDAALDRAARTVLSARRTIRGPRAASLAGGVPAPVDLAPMPVTAEGGDTVGDAWLAAAMAAGVYLPVAERVAARTLGGYAACLREAMTVEPADVDTAYRVGLEVVAMGIGRHEALPATMVVVLDHLSDGDRLGPPARQVAGAFAAGVAAALQARTLAQQESLHRATQRAARDYQVALQNSEARYRRLAYYDPVTGLANRTRLVQRLRQAANSEQTPGRHAGLCLIELGGHPAACERHGGEAGDHVLGEVARRLQLVAGHPDYLLARHGSHSFALLVQDSGGLAHLADLAERITRMLAEPSSLPSSGLTAPLQAHVGVVDCPTAGLDPARVLVDAEVALRHARSSSTGWAVYDPQPADGGARGTSVTGLVTGPPTYQPVVKLGNGRIMGLHSRTSWRHPHLGTLDLTRIGQLTGDRETTTRLAAGLVQQACRQAMQWDGGKKGPFIGLDVPVYQIGYPDVVELVREALADSGLPPRRLHLQLTGADTAPSGSHSLIVLTALAELGVRLVLDDYGMGYTSLAYLRELPVHGLRTPAALLHGTAAGAESDRNLLAGMARTAHALGLTLTVHGVDDELRAATLLGTGCDGAQGVRYGAPATPHQVPALLRGAGKLVAIPDRADGLVAS